MYQNMIMQVLMRVLMHQLGSKVSQNASNPFTNPFGAQQQEQDDGPIHVESDVVDFAAYTHKENVSRSTVTALPGHEVKKAPRVYELLIGIVICAAIIAWSFYTLPLAGVLLGTLAFAAAYDVRVKTIPWAVPAIVAITGIVMRILHLLAGNILSLTIVPVALGLIFSVVILLVFLILNHKLEICRNAAGPRDIVLLFTLAFGTGWAGVVTFVVSYAIALFWQKARGYKSFPTCLPWAFMLLLWWIVVQFPGLS